MASLTRAHSYAAHMHSCGELVLDGEAGAPQLVSAGFGTMMERVREICARPRQFRLTRERMWQQLDRTQFVLCVAAPHTGPVPPVLSHTHTHTRGPQVLRALHGQGRPVPRFRAPDLARVDRAGAHGRVRADPAGHGASRQVSSVPPPSPSLPS